MNPAALFLTPEELKELTGRSRAEKQITILKQNRIPFYLNAAGKPKVTREAIQYNKPKPQPKPAAPQWQPAPPKP